MSRFRLTAVIAAVVVAMAVQLAGPPSAFAAWIAEPLGSGLDEPCGLACYRGLIVVADRQNRAIKVTGGGGTNTLVSADECVRDVAVDVYGSLYYTMDSREHVFKMYNDWSTESFPVPDVPYGVALDGTGNIYVSSDTANEIYALNPDGDLTQTLTGFNQPFGIAIGGDGKVYVANAGTDSIIRMNADGTGRETVGSGFNQPRDVAVDGSGNIYVCDTYNDAVKRLDSAGNNIETMGTGYSRPCGVAIDGDNKIYVADSNNDAVKRVSEVPEPDVLPTFGEFTDTDSSEGKIGGDITWIAADPPDGITGYRVYWGSSTTTRLAGHTDVLYTVAGAASESQAVAAGTALPSGATHFLIYSYNAAGDSADCLAVPITDTLPIDYVIRQVEGIFQVNGAGAYGSLSAALAVCTDEGDDGELLIQFSDGPWPLPLDEVSKSGTSANEFHIQEPDYHPRGDGGPGVSRRVSVWRRFSQHQRGHEHHGDQ